MSELSNITIILVDCGQLYLSSKQITEFFDQYYLWRVSIDISFFFRWDIHQGKVAFQISTSG